MRIQKTINASELRGKTGDIYSDVLDGKITRITNRSRKPMVLMSEADFLSMAKQINKDASK